MKKILLAAAAAFGIYTIAKKLNAKKEESFIGNNLAVDVNENEELMANGSNVTNNITDKGDWANNEVLPDENNNDKEILADGGNELGGTGGSIKNSAGDSKM